MAAVVGRKTNICYSLGKHFAHGTKVTGCSSFTYWLHSGHAHKTKYFKTGKLLNETSFLKSYFSYWLIIFIFTSTNSRFYSPKTKLKKTPWSRVHPELLKKFPLFIEPVGSSPFLQQPATCSYPEPGQSGLCLHSTSRRSILILSSHLRLGFQSGLLPSDFHTEALYAPLLFLIRATCPAHLNLLHVITGIIFSEEYRA